MNIFLQLTVLELWHAWQTSTFNVCIKEQRWHCHLSSSIGRQLLHAIHMYVLTRLINVHTLQFHISSTSSIEPKALLPRIVFCSFSVCGIYKNKIFIKIMLSFDYLFRYYVRAFFQNHHRYWHDLGHLDPAKKERGRWCVLCMWDVTI